MHKKSRANFLYRIGIVDNQKILLIWDLNLGNMSVTNDIENVVDDIAYKEKIVPEEHTVLYRDSEGHWDGWDHAQGSFFYLRTIHGFFLKRIATILDFNFESPTIS